jgi:hypothetical protein
MRHRGISVEIVLPRRNTSCDFVTVARRLGFVYAGDDATGTVTLSAVEWVWPVV